MTINSVSCKLSSNRAFTPFSDGLQFKSRRSGGLQFLSGTQVFTMMNVFKVYTREIILFGGIYLRHPENVLKTI